ncbi:sigma factor [Nonomuraea sp. NPDC001684]
MLFSVVYNMLGSVADTEDVLQEAWLAWSARHRRPDAGAVENVRAYLVRIAVNQALARRADLSRRQETYVGPWLPEPLVTAPDAEVTERFAAAALGGDLRALLEVLAPEVTLWTDGGGKGPATSLHPVHGRDQVAALFMSVAATLTPGAVDLRYRRVAGDPCALVFSGDGPLAVVVVDLTPEGDRIAAVYSVTNPDKLTGIR